MQVRAVIKRWRCWVASVALSCSALLAPSVASADAAADYARPAELQSPQLSPSGKRLAMVVSAPDGSDRLAVMDLDQDRKVRAVAGFAQARIPRFAWINDERLIFTVYSTRNGADLQRNDRGVLAVNQDGSGQRQLMALRDADFATGSNVKSRMLNWEWDWLDPVGDGSDDVWVVRTVYDNQGEWTNSIMGRLNSGTGQLSVASAGVPEHLRSWMHGGTGEGDVITTRWDGIQRLFHRARPDASWTLLQEVDDLSRRAWDPVAFDGPGALLVTTHNGGDTNAVFRLDMAKRALDREPVLALKGFDLSPELWSDGPGGPVLGMSFLADQPASYWFDDGLDGIQRAIDASLPRGRVNLISCNRCAKSQNLLVWSQSDTQPGEAYVYNREKRSLTLIDSSRPWIDPAKQGRRSFHRITTRDGLSMPVYVTHPAGHERTERLPTVMLVHGGPYVRGVSSSWSAEPQYLASLGYRVIEPEFRGSWGYGAALSEAGVQAWGRGMQDDLLDALKWADGQGMIDPGRVCIVGASYGGYAALMGAVRDGQAYRCAVSFAGVTDIELMHTAWGSDASEQTKKFYMRRMIGDPKAAAQQEVSPLRRVAEIKIPVLLMHGIEDRRVPIGHARDFDTAARKAGAKVELVTYEREAHGFVLQDNEADYYRRIGAFLAKHLAPR